MRRALGQLGTARKGQPEPLRRKTFQVTPGAGRHRFRQDGEVPVVRISLATAGQGGRRQGQAPAGLVAAGQGRAGEGRSEDGAETSRQVQELTEQLRTALTRLGHAELALAEAGRAAQARQDEAAGLRQALDAAETALAQARAELVASERAREVRVPVSQKDDASHRKVGRPLGSYGPARREATASKQEPVKWWTGD